MYILVYNLIFVLILFQNISHQNQGRVKTEAVLKDDVIDLTGDDDSTRDTVLQQSIAALTQEVEPRDSPAVSLHEETNVSPESTVKKEHRDDALPPVPAIVIKPESTVSQVPDVLSDTIDGPSTSSLRVMPTRHSTFRPNYTESSGDEEKTGTESEESVHSTPMKRKYKVSRLIYFIYLN